MEAEAGGFELWVTLFLERGGVDVRGRMWLWWWMGGVWRRRFGVVGMVSEGEGVEWGREKGQMSVVGNFARIDALEVRWRVFFLFFLGAFDCLFVVRIALGFFGTTNLLLLLYLEMANHSL